jgi:hypothetical protein
MGDGAEWRVENGEWQLLPQRAELPRYTFFSTQNATEAMTITTPTPCQTVRLLPDPTHKHELILVDLTRVGLDFRRSTQYLTARSEAYSQTTPSVHREFWLRRYAPD